MSVSRSAGVGGAVVGGGGGDIITIPGQLYLPEPVIGVVSALGPVASTTAKVAQVFQAPVTGPLDRAAFRIHSASAAADVVVRIETIVGGLPSGTLVAADAEAAVPAAQIFGDNTAIATFSTPPTLTRGQPYAVVVASPVGAPNYNLSAWGGPYLRMPYRCTATTGGYSKSTDPLHLQVSMNGIWRQMNGMGAPRMLSSFTLSPTSLPRDRGNRFTLHHAARIEGAWIGTFPTDTMLIQLLDLNNTVLAQTENLGGALHNATSVGQIVGRYLFSQPVDLKKGFQGRIFIRALSSSFTLAFNSYISADVMKGIPGGTDWFRTSRITPTDVWEDSTTSRDSIGLIASGIG